MTDKDDEVKQLVEEIDAELGRAMMFISGICLVFIMVIVAGILAGWW